MENTQLMLLSLVCKYYEENETKCAVDIESPQTLIVILQTLIKSNLDDYRVNYLEQECPTEAGQTQDEINIILCLRRNET